MLLVIAVFFTAINAYLFNRAVAGEIDKLTGDAGNNTGKTVHNIDISNLPEPVRKYFQYALKDQREIIRFVRLKQEGLFRLKDDPNLDENEGWSSLKAEQYFTTKEPEFIWCAEIKMAPFLWIKGWDRYHQGEGNMLWKMLSAIKIVDARDEMLNQGALSRYLAETPWFPTALLPGDQLRWEAVNSNSAKAVLKDRDLKVSIIFHFNNQGQITHAEMPNRARMVDNQYVSTPWTAYYRNYQEIDGMMIPTEGEVAWNLGSGNFSYAKLKITDIKYNFSTTHRRLAHEERIR